MNTCLSSLRLLSSQMDRYRAVHSSEVVMIMLLVTLRRRYCCCRRRVARGLPCRPLVHAPVRRAGWP